jgi:hypothetical protein
MMFGLLEAVEGRTAEAWQRAEAAHAKWPRSEEVAMARADIAVLTGRDEAAAAFESLMHVPELVLAFPHTVRLRVAYYAHGRGDTARAADLLAEAERVARARLDGGDESALPRLELAGVAAIRGEREAALEWLSRAFDAGYRNPVWVERSPILAPLAGDPRFTALVDRMRADVAAQLARARARGLLDFTALLPH